MAGDEPENIYRISTDFLHSSLRKRLGLQEVPYLSGRGPMNRYAFGVSFVYEKGSATDILKNWPDFLSKFCRDYSAMGFHGGIPPRKRISSLSCDTVFVLWRNKNMTNLSEMYITRRFFVAMNRHRKEQIAATCGILKIRVHKIFGLDETESLDRLPPEYQTDYDECDVISYEHGTAEVPTTTDGNSVENNSYRTESPEGNQSRKRKRLHSVPDRRAFDEEVARIKKRAVRDTMGSTSGSGGRNDGYVEIEDMKVQMIDRTEDPVPVSARDARQIKDCASDIDMRNSESPASTVDQFFSNMQTVRDEITSLRNENARLTEALHEEQQRRMHAERAVAKVRQAVLKASS